MGVKLTSTSPRARFREARERLGLSETDIPGAAVWDIECIEGDLTSTHSPRQLQEFCKILQIRPIDLFADDFSEPAVSAAELVTLIHQECRQRGVTLDQFEDAVGWRLSQCIEPPDHLLEDMSLDGLQWLCRELCIDWRRVLLSL